MDVFKRLNYEPIPSAPSGPSNGAPTTVVNVGGPGLLGHPSFSKPKHPIPSLLRQPTLPPADDPFGLASKVYPEEELAEIKKSDVRAFYRRQNETIERFLNPPAGEIEDPEAEEMSTATKVKIAVWASTIANAFLFAGQGYAAYITGSLALFATMADAMMDLVSSIVLLATSRAVRHVDKERFPTGKSRLEVLGVIVFATLMSTVALQLIIEGVKGIVAHTGEKQETDRLAIVFILGALVMKTVLLIYCLTLREFLSARTLAQDHRNDIIINSFGLATALGGVYFAGWVDPVGCLLVGLFILRSWGSTAFEQIELLVGTSAEPEFLNLLTYLTLTFDERIEAIDTVRCYTAGNYYLAEIDIVLPKTMSVLESHDIAQALQDFIEELPAIERCFVHIDYETEHVPEHSPESRQQFRSALQAPVSPPILAEHAPVSRQ